MTAGLPVEIYVKCEFLNPGGSHKDRLAANLLRRAEEDALKLGRNDRRGDERQQWSALLAPLAALREATNASSSCPTR